MEEIIKMIKNGKRLDAINTIRDECVPVCFLDVLRELEKRDMHDEIIKMVVVGGNEGFISYNY